MNSDPHEPFSDDDFICYGCFKDPVLATRIKRQGKRETCVLCRRSRRAVPIWQVGGWLKDVLPMVIEPGRYGYRYDRFSDTEHFQGGQPLADWLRELLGIEDDRLVDALVGDVTSVSHADYLDGETEPAWSDEVSCVAAHTSTFRLSERWRDFEESINHRFRFFNEEARAFLADLFADLPQYRSRNVPEWPPQGSPGTGERTTPVIRRLEPSEGWPIYRPRLAPGESDLERFESDTPAELGPPPSLLARAGRMNPEGVSVFYGCGDRETCVSELRPHMDAQVATAEFRLTKPILVLDFRVLEDFFREKPPSIFDDNYGEENELRVFLRTLHRLIRAPIRPGEERSYLRTQVLAEYLVTQHDPPIQGVLFSSTQNEAGANLVLFPNAETAAAASLSAADIPDFDDPTAPLQTKTASSPLAGFPLTFVNESLQFHRVGGIRYDILRLPSLQDQREPDWEPEF